MDATCTKSAGVHVPRARVESESNPNGPEAGAFEPPQPVALSSHGVWSDTSESQSVPQPRRVLLPGCIPSGQGPMLSITVNWRGKEESYFNSVYAVSEADPVKVFRGRMAGRPRTLANDCMGLDRGIWRRSKAKLRSMKPRFR
jgi:hypothetical protein